MLNLLNKLTLVGSTPNDSYQKKRRIRTLNAINLIFLAVFLANMLINISLWIRGHHLSFHTLSSIILIVISCINLILIAAKHYPVARLITVLLNPTLLLSLPLLTGQVDNGIYFWFPLVPITMSFISHLLYRNKEGKTSLYIALGFYLLLTLSSADILLRFSPADLEITPIVKENLLFYRIASGSMFIFLNLSIYYFLYQSNRHEEWLEQAHTKIKEQSEELQTQNDFLLEQQQLLEAKNKELQKLLHELEATQSTLIQNEKMLSLGTLTTGVAKEINNPIKFISSSLQNLESLFEDLKNPALSENERILKLNQGVKTLPGAVLGVERISRIVRSLLSFAEKSPQQEINLNKLINSTLLIIGHNIPKNITINKNLDASIPVIRGQKDQLHQILLSIIDNAIWACKEEAKSKDKEIRINTTQAGSDFIMLTIANNGPKIPDDVIDKIFDPFFSTRPGRTGLGLTTAYNLIHYQEGNIKAENNQETGFTEFHVSLPLLQQKSFSD